MTSVWEKSLSLIRDKVNNHNFDTWIRPLKLLFIDDSTVEIEVPNKFFQDWLHDHYFELISNTLKEVGNKDFSLKFRVKKENGKLIRAAAKLQPQPDDPKPESRSELKVSLPPIFDQRFSFDKFVSGSSNQFAKAAAMAVSNNPGKTYNPLFIYGGVGLGKTHLLKAIGLHILTSNNKAKVLYITGENFINDFVTAMRFGKGPELKSKYRNLDALLIDDIQFLAGKEATQEEFFHIFNSLFESRKQIVMTSDSFPKDIQKLDERLRSRFEWGLTVDIQPPELELRLAILRNKADLNSFHLVDDVVTFIASHFTSNIRELEGALINVCAFASFNGEEITIELAKKVLKIKDEKRILTVDSIQKMVAGYYNIKVSDLKSQRKLKNITIPRQVAMFLCRNLTGLSYPQIGSDFGNKDHSTVIHACKKIEKEMHKDHLLKEAVDNLSKRLCN